MVEAGWHLGHVTDRATIGELDEAYCADDGTVATFRVAYYHDADLPDVAATDHAFHRFFAESYAVDEDASVWSWVLLAPVELIIASQPQGTRGCGWPGCPGSSMRFSSTRLLQHVRHNMG